MGKQMLSDIGEKQCWSFLQVNHQEVIKQN